MLTQNELEFYESLGIYAWYKELISNFTCEVDEIQRKHDRKKVEDIIKDLGYCFLYHSSSKIFSVPTKYKGIDFFCNPEIRDGLVRVYLYAENKSTKKRLGDNLISICRLIEIAKGEDSGKYMLLPRFKNYDELRQILTIIFEKYEEFKIELINSEIISTENT